MPYEALATSKTPALVIYVLDVSASMTEPLGGKRRIDVVMDALGAALRSMVFRSTKGSHISPRYRIGMLAYSDHVYDLLDGIKGVDEVAKLGVPELSTLRATDSAKAFALAEKMLADEVGRSRNCPAPLLCHMTDGEYTGGDPEPIARRIKGLSVADGNVLVENIYISDKLLPQPIGDAKEWRGVVPTTMLPNRYADKLCRMSSALPESYRMLLAESGFQLTPGCVMMLPGTSPELVALGFQMSAATPIR